MDVREALRNRRSIKKFTDRPVTRADIVALLETVAFAPNHHLTQPWRLYVLGPAARRAYGDVLGARKARKVDDPDAGRMVREKVAAEHAALPAMIAVAMRLDESPEKREEDYAAVMMGVQNLLLAAVERGLGTHLKTGAVMDDPAARAAVGVADDERIVAIINLGEPADVPAPKERAAVASHTVWRD
jgi:nitroreductase